MGTNRDHFEAGVDADGVAPALLDVCYDPQTSGGLLVSVESAFAEAMLAELRAAAVPAVLIGDVQPRGGAFITLR
jgi:selenide,water dikinase